MAQTCAHATQAAAVKKKRKSSSFPTLLPSPSRFSRENVLDGISSRASRLVEVVVFLVGGLPTTCDTSATQLEDRPLLNVLEIEDVFQ